MESGFRWPSLERTLAHYISSSIYRSKVRTLWPPLKYTSRVRRTTGWTTLVAQHRAIPVLATPAAEVFLEFEVWDRPGPATRTGAANALSTQPSAAPSCVPPLM
jgi:hypothetical protein